MRNLYYDYRAARMETMATARIAQVGPREGQMDLFGAEFTGIPTPDELERAVQAHDQPGGVVMVEVADNGDCGDGISLEFRLDGRERPLAWVQLTPSQAAMVAHALNAAVEFRSRERMGTPQANEGGTHGA